MSGRARRATRPTPCLFGATLGLRADCSRLTRACGHRARGGFALRLAGARLGKDPGSGECTKGKQQLGQGIASYGGKAAPTRATRNKFNRGLDVLSVSAPKSRSIARSSETIFAVLKFLISADRKFSNSRFRKFPIAQNCSLRTARAYRTQSPGADPGKPLWLVER
jgi:hypothetical protein